MSGSATVTVADILELRAGGLKEEEIWSLLCQAVQTLQDLFLSEKITDGKIVPLVTPNTIGLNSRGRVLVSPVRRIHSHQKPYLAPEYGARGKTNLKNLDWEKMWIFSLGKTLLFALKATSDSRSLMVLKFMTTKDPTLRASLMSLFNVISEHCKINLPLKPFSHLVMEMYKEVFGTPSACVLPSDNSGSCGFETERNFTMESFFEDHCYSLNPKKETYSKTSSMDGGINLNKRSASTKRHPVQRAPSRLYRGPFASTSTSPKTGRRFSPNACVGPEFVVRGMESSKVVHVGDVKASQRRSLTVILLTGQKIRITCDPHSITCGKLFEILVLIEDIEDNYIFGLSSIINGDFVFIPSEMKLHKVAPSGWKDGGKEPNSVNFFLRSILEQQIKCELQELFALGGLALQAEFGNFIEKEHGVSSYFLLEHYLPEELIDERLEQETLLQENHKSRGGLEPDLAEEIFVSRVQRLPEYGSHHYTAIWVRKYSSIPMWVTVNPEGVYLYEKKENILDRKIHEAFVWKSIHGLSCNENYFRLVPQDVLGRKIPCYKLRLDSKKSFFLFRLASFHHQFFLKLRVELSPLLALSQEFGISLKKETKNVFYVEDKTNYRNLEGLREETRCTQKTEKATSEFRQNIEERQNKENENPSENKREKRIGVKMGVSAFHLTSSGTADFFDRSFSFSEVRNNSLGAYVLDSSIKSLDEQFTYDLHESIPLNLADKWDDVSWEEERILKKIRLTKDKYGSFGLEIVEGSNGGLFVENVLKKREAKETAIQRGDQLMSVNGICLLNLNYSQALSVLKSTGSEIEILVSQNCKRETPRKPFEHEYLKHIRYETANETENLVSEVQLKNGLR